MTGLQRASIAMIFFLNAGLVIFFGRLMMDARELVASTHGAGLLIAAIAILFVIYHFVLLRECISVMRNNRLIWGWWSIWVTLVLSSVPPLMVVFLTSIGGVVA